MKEELENELKSYLKGALRKLMVMKKEMKSEIYKDKEDALRAIHMV